MQITRDAIARRLAESHSALEGSVLKIVRLVSDEEDSPDEPIKLLEINSDTVPSGIVPVFFGPSGDIPYPSVVLEVTPDEYDRVESDELPLPKGWQRDITLFERNGGN